MMAGPRALDLDFQREPGQRARLTGRALFLLGAVLLAAASAEYASVEQQRAALQESVAQARHAKTRSVASPAGEGDREATVKAVNAVVSQLAAPWGSFFSQVEAASGDDVALLGLHADPAGGTVRLNGEARNFAAVTAYVRRLEATAAVRNVTLSGHEVREQDPQRPVAFTLSARWGSRP